jgi:hypothetical protein
MQKTLELTDQTTDTTQGPEHTHLKFVTLVTTSVEKITKLHGFNL